ncbi:MAG: serine protease [Cyclobacteriaceae bacterium]
MDNTLSLNQLELIHQRWLKRQKSRNKHLNNLDDITKIEPPERIQKRLNHLAQIKKKKVYDTPHKIIQEIGHERIIGDDDFLGINFFEVGLAVSRSVCKVHVLDGSKRFLGSGTGFMVSPSLMITNNHVLESVEIGMNSTAEFDFQLDRRGNTLPSVHFAFDPVAFFHTNQALDYSLIAVKPIGNSGKELSGFGWNKMLGEGKALIGDPLNIIQHPNWRMT